MNIYTLYWAAPRFTQAERLWNRFCADYLQQLGYQVVLPQVVAKDFIDAAGNINAAGLAGELGGLALDANVMVAILDGADADSGVSRETGLRDGYRSAEKFPTRTIGVRTDFRGTGDDGALNLMFRPLDTIVFFPSFNEDYRALCHEIDEAIKKLDANINAT